VTDQPGPPGPPTDRLRLVQQVARLALTLASRLQDNYAAHAATLGLTAAQIKVLTALQPDESVAMRVLARRIGFDQSNLTGLVDKLEARDAVLRVPDRADRRIKSLVLTEVGQALRTAFWQRLTSDAGPLDHLSAQQLEALHDALLPALDEAENGDPTRVADTEPPPAARAVP